MCVCLGGWPEALFNLAPPWPLAGGLHNGLDVRRKLRLSASDQRVRFRHLQGKAGQGERAWHALLLPAPACIAGLAVA